MIPRDRQPRPGSVGVTGWLCVALGGLMIFSAAVLALGDFMRRSLEEQGFDPLAQIEGALDPLSRMVLQNPGTISASQFVLGIATLAIGIGFLALRSWARPALEILAWITLVVSIASGVWGIIAWLGPGGFTPVSSLEGLVTPVAGMVLTLAQCVACALVIRYLRTPEIRALFQERRVRKEPGSGEGGNQEGRAGKV